jgi:glycosyltransferase involved in cell wall biosynthesis
VLPQALLAGRPVISCDVDGAREVVRDGETGFLVAPRDVQSLAARIVQLSTSRALREKLAAAGRDECRTRFDHGEMTRQIHDLYGRLLTAHRTFTSGKSRVNYSK